MFSEKIVILIHALSTNKYYMYFIEKYLKNKGFIVYNWDYESRKYTIADLAKQLNDYIILNRLNNCNLNFVTYSMGAIVLRYYAKYYSVYIDKTVMLAPPNSGSEIVDKLKNNYFYKKLLGPSAISIGTEADDIPKSLGEFRHPVGIISGNLSLDPFCSLFLPKPNDGKVSVENSRLNGMTDNIIIRTSHMLMPFNKPAITETYYFLEHGKFSERYK